MNKAKLYQMLLWSLLSLTIGRPSYAVDVYSFITDVNDPRANIKSISDALLVSGNLTEAKSYNDTAAQIKFEMASDLYASALSTRAKLIRDAKEQDTKEQEDGDSKLLGGAESTQEILANEVQPNLQQIVERLSSIVDLEAKISALEGVSAILPLQYTPEEEE